MQPDVRLPFLLKASQTWRCHAWRIDYNILTMCRRGTRAQQQPAAATDMPNQGSKAAKWKQQSSQLRAAMQAARPGQVNRWCVCWAHERAVRHYATRVQGSAIPAVLVSAATLGRRCSCLTSRRVQSSGSPSLQHCAARKAVPVRARENSYGPDATLGSSQHYCIPLLSSSSCRGRRHAIATTGDWSSHNQQGPS